MAAAVLLCAACNAAPEPPPASNGPVYGGTAVVGGYVELRGMNPFATVTDLNKALERYALYMPLVLLDSALAPVPWLAESWDTTAIGRDSLDRCVPLRRDVRWQDGRPTTARDVATHVPPRHGSRRRRGWMPRRWPCSQP
jgi:ABC-type transport system substrate-binding protein